MCVNADVRPHEGSMLPQDQQVPVVRKWVLRGHSTYWYEKWLNNSRLAFFKKKDKQWIYVDFIGHIYG